jgi:transposase
MSDSCRRHARSRACRAKPEWEIPDVLWEKFRPVIPPGKKKPGGRGRPPVDPRRILNAIFHVLRTGGQWRAPNPHAPGSSAHRYFQLWLREGVFRRFWEAGLLEYDALRGIGWQWQSMDGAMTKAPLGGEKDRPEPHGPRQIGDQAQRA